MKNLYDGIEQGCPFDEPISYGFKNNETSKHLEWIFNRMVNVHGENPNYDYMIKFKEIIDKTKQKNNNGS